jgi:dTMP kinase
MKIAIITTVVLLILGTSGFFIQNQNNQRRLAEAEAARTAEQARIDAEHREALLAQEREAEALRLAAARAAREEEENRRLLVEKERSLAAAQQARALAERQAAEALARQEAIARRQAELEAEKARLTALQGQERSDFEAKLAETLAALQAETLARSAAEREAEERRARLAAAMERQRIQEEELAAATLISMEVAPEQPTRTSNSAPYEYRRRSHLRLGDQLERAGVRE